MVKLGLNDRVRIVTDEHGQAGLTGHITEVEGNDYIPHELPYRVRGYWYRAADLVLIADADVIEYARHEPPADVQAVGEPLSALGLLAQAVSSSVSWDRERHKLYIEIGDTEYSFDTDTPIQNPTAKAIWALWQYTLQWERKAAQPPTGAASSEGGA